MDIISLHSQKGGTGKTSIALGLAVESARRQKKPLLIDLDFSGTSLRDIIQLKQGEKVSTIEDYFLDPRKNNPEDYISHAEVVDQRTNTKIDIPVMLDDSSHVYKMMSFVYKENHSAYLEARLEGLIETLAKGNQIQTIILDNSPGAWGLSNAILNIVQRTHIRTNTEIAYRGIPILVSSTDLNDVMSCLNLQNSPGDRHKKYKFVINRSSYTSNPPTNIVAHNINELSNRLDAKAQPTNDEGTKGLANLLRTKSIGIDYVFPEDGTMAQMYRAHFQTFPTTGLDQIQQFSQQVLGWQ